MNKREAQKVFNRKTADIIDWLSFDQENFGVTLDGWYVPNELRVLADAIEEYFENIKKEDDATD